MQSFVGETADQDAYGNIFGVAITTHRDSACSTATALSGGNFRQMSVEANLFKRVGGNFAVCQVAEDYVNRSNPTVSQAQAIAYNDCGSGYYKTTATHETTLHVSPFTWYIQVTSTPEAYNA